MVDLAFANGKRRECTVAVGSERVGNRHVGERHIAGVLHDDRERRKLSDNHLLRLRRLLDIDRRVDHINISGITVSNGIAVWIVGSDIHGVGEVSVGSHCACVGLRSTDCERSERTVAVR